MTIAAIEELRSAGLHLPDGAVAAGMREVYWPARMEVVAWHPLTVLDCAHNVASAAALVQTLAVSFPARRRVLLFAGSSDKDVAGMFQILQPHFDMAFLTRYTNNPRSIAPDSLAEMWSSAGPVPMKTSQLPLECCGRTARGGAGWPVMRHRVRVSRGGAAPPFPRRPGFRSVAMLPVVPRAVLSRMAQTLLFTAFFAGGFLTWRVKLSGRRVSVRRSWREVWHGRAEETAAGDIRDIFPRGRERLARASRRKRSVA